MTIEEANNLVVGDLVGRGTDGLMGYKIARPPYKWGQLTVVDLIDRFNPKAPIIRVVPIEEIF